MWFSFQVLLTKISPMILIPISILVIIQIPNTIPIPMVTLFPILPLPPPLPWTPEKGPYSRNCIFKLLNNSHSQIYLLGLQVCRSISKFMHLPIPHLTLLSPWTNIFCLIFSFTLYSWGYIERKLFLDEFFLLKKDDYVNLTFLNNLAETCNCLLWTHAESRVHSQYPQCGGKRLWNVVVVNIPIYITSNS